MLSVTRSCLRLGVRLVEKNGVASISHRVLCPTKMAFHKYAESLNKTLTENVNNQGKLHVVLGNEACDLDSAVCALVTGYYFSTIDGPPSVPMLCIPRCDYCLKTEVRYLLEELNINTNSLCFLDDLDLADLHRRNLLELTLVDHNVLPHSLASLESAVVRVIDHHKWERRSSGSLEKVWAMTGSCATLVGEKILSTKREIIDKTVARLLQSAIIVDTVNFSEKAEKTTPRDVAVFNELRSSSAEAVDWCAEFEKLKKAKEDISSLSVGDLLRKDLKVIREKISIAISSVPAALDEFLAMRDVEEQLENFRKRENIDSVVVMLSKCCGDELRRWLIILGNDARLTDTILKRLETFANPSLEVEAIDISTALLRSTSLPVFILQQNNVACSRKVVLPVLRELAATESRVI